MSIYRTYFSQDNTLISNSYINTGQNPVTELFYGTEQLNISRYIFTFDLTNVIQQLSDFTIPNTSAVTHTLKMTNTLAYDKDLLGQALLDNKDHASSFDLVVFEVPQYWDEGIGYDYPFNNIVLDINGKIYATSSNWYQATDLVNWYQPGIYTGTTGSTYFNPITTIHFDLGNEDISLDLTSYINGLIVSGTSNFYGLGLAYTWEYETMKTNCLYSVGFFGKDTNTFFEPFIETAWPDTIDDDRNEFFYDKLNKLYLYTNQRKDPINLDVLPSAVTIYDYNSNVAMVITAVTHEAKGVYSVQLRLNSVDYDSINLVNFGDVWSGIIISGNTYNDIGMNFTVKLNQYYNLGNETYEPDVFSFNFTGIKRAEKIPQGEVRKVIIETKETFGYDNLIVDNINYRMFVKQGRNQIEIIPPTRINRAFNQNYFYLDTSWMIPQEYFLEIIVNSNGTTTTKDYINFIIIDSVNNNINFQI